MSEGYSESYLALAQALSEEFEIDLDEIFLARVDCILVRLWMRGFIVAEAPKAKE